MKCYYSVSSLTGRRAGIRGYEYGNTYIIIYFANGSVYKYTVGSCGLTHIENMKRLADEQSGLSSYIAKFKPLYSSKR